MAARLLFLGKLRDVGADLSAAPAEMETVGQLRAWLERAAPDLALALASAKVRVAIDGELTHDDNASIVNAREVAFLPPMSGG
jgi:molybdopterin converting factor small subunit